MTVFFSKLGEYGKLANSMFQASCTIALAKRNGDSYIFPHTWIYKNSFNLPHSSFVPPHTIKPSSTYSENHFHYSPIPYKPSMDLFGYFQSWKYFDDFKDEIRKIFTPKHQAQFRPDTASIHVRRTDYLKFPNHHPTLGMGYYEKAMELVGVNKFLVFSDDIAWCKQHFKGNEFEFSEGQTEVADLALQSKCAHNIIANSSFSWWAAWLNNNENKLVVAPKKWFGPALLSHNTKDLYLPNWIKI